MDDCFNDYIPVAEIFGTLLIWAWGIAFWYFAKRLFSADAAADGLDDTRNDPARGWLVWHFLGGVGVAWSVLNFLGVPLNLKYYFPLIFWIGFTIWFLVGIAIAPRPFWQIGAHRPVGEE
jgi:hypothetical protein